MKITNAVHKVFLYNQFFTMTLNGLRPKSFSVESIAEAASVFKKLKKDSTEENVALDPSKPEETITKMSWGDDEIEFSVDEAKFIKDTLNGIKNLTVGEYDTIEELKEIFK